MFSLEKKTDQGLVFKCLILTRCVNEIGNKIANGGCVCIFSDPTFYSVATIFFVNKRVQAFSRVILRSELSPYLSTKLEISKQLMLITDLPFIQIFLLKFSEIQITWLQIQIFLALNLVEISL